MARLLAEASQPGLLHKTQARDPAVASFDSKGRLRSAGGSLRARTRLPAFLAPLNAVAPISVRNFPHLL